MRAVGSDNNSGVRGGVDAGSDLTAAATGSETIQQGGGGGAGLRKDRLRSGRGGNKLRTQVVTGMTLEQASQKGAVIANVGADKPAWQ